MINVRKLKDEVVTKFRSTGALHVFIGNTLIKFVAFFGSIFLVKLLTKDDYGQLSYVENLFHYIYIFAGFGLNNGLLRYLVIARTQSEKQSYYSYILRTSILINLLLVVSSLFSFQFYGHPADFDNANIYLLILLLAIPFQYLTETQITVHRAYFNNKTYAWNSFLVTTTFIVLKYYLARSFGLVGAVSASIVVYSIYGILLSVYVRKKYFTDRTHTASLPKSIKKLVLSYSFQYMVTNGVWAIFMLNDVFLLGRFLGDSQIIANYKVAYVLPANLSMFSSSIGVVVAPYFMKRENDTQWVKSSSRKTVIGTLVLLTPIAAVLFFFAEPIITLLYSKVYVEVIPVMRVLLVASLVNNGLRYTYANLLASMGKVKYNLIVSILGVILQLSINVFAIPRFGSMGLALTSVFVYAIMGIILHFVFKKVVIQASTA